MAPPLPILVAGPTASGKSALALALAEEFGGAIINADSMQVYRDLRVLTARPGPAEEARAPHYLYGTIDAAEACSAGRWRGMALAAIEEAGAHGHVPILAGGTGLYLQALVHGLAALPPIAPEVRAASRALYAELGGPGFRARLAERDPEAAARLQPGDSQRLIRAFEVVVATGRPLGDWQRRAQGARLPVLAVVLLPPRDVLYAACDARFAAMMDGGAIVEVEALLARGLAPDLPAMKAVGVREIAAYLRGELTREAAIAAAQQATRRYAKRQFTWLRHRMTGMQTLTIETQYSERIAGEIFAFIRRHLLTALI